MLPVVTGENTSKKYLPSPSSSGTVESEVLCSELCSHLAVEPESSTATRAEEQDDTQL